MSSNLGVWFQVPDQSTMEFWVEPDGDFHARARYKPNNGPEEILEHDDLVPGLVSRTVAPGASYAVRFAVTFQSAETETTTIHARVTSPGGDAIPPEYSYTIQGIQGQLTRRATLVIVNKNAV